MATYCALEVISSYSEIMVALLDRDGWLQLGCFYQLPRPFIIYIL